VIQDSPKGGMTPGGLAAQTDYDFPRLRLDRSGYDFGSYGRPVVYADACHPAPE
jgi:hypothetical protein